MVEPFLYPELYIDRSLETSGKKASEFLAWFKKEIEPFLEEYFDEKIREASEVHPEAVVLVEEIRRMVGAGGKKIRSAFAYAAYVASGGRSHEAILYASAAFELWHTFAIIHDDIIDESNLRRGQPTAHIAFDKFHQNRNFSGDSQRFGISAAILAGDLAFSFADELLDSAPFPAERIRRAKIYYNAMKQQTVYGEHLDVISH